MPSQPFDEFDDLFDLLARQFAGMGWTVVDDAGARAASEVAVDVAAYDDQVVVVADFLAFGARDVDVSLSPDAVTLQAHRRPAAFGTSITHEVPLPGGLDVEGARTSFNNGVLTVTLPVVDDADVSTDGTAIDIE